MSFNPTLRRNQLIAPFGVGAIHVLKGSRAVVTAGLDYWFRDATSQQIQHVCIREPRLESKLGVSHFRLPPGPETELKDMPQLEIPLFRFPTWYVCPRCNRMEQRQLGMDGDAKCKESSCRDEVMRQVRFAAVCDHGHLQDFPWKQWMRREVVPECQEEKCPLYYHAGGSGSLADITVGCRKCGKKRNLSGIMSGDMPDEGNPRGSSTLSRLLLAREAGEEATEGCPEFTCQGGRVWLGEPSGQSCQRPLRAVLINATNVHYAQVESALWIPPADVGPVTRELRMLLDRPEIRNQIRMLKTFRLPLQQIAQSVLKSHATLFKGVELAHIEEAMSEGSNAQDTASLDGLDPEEAIRFPEFQQLQTARAPATSDDALEIRIVDNERLNEHLRASLREVIAGISLVDKLRETRVYRGFNRLVPQHVEGAPHPQFHLWRNPPAEDAEKWLPCSVVFGEGIFIRFEEDRLSVWENSDDVTRHLLPLQERENRAASRMGRPARAIRPRFVFLHTLAHLLIRRLVFECGYGSASLRERLYVSDNPRARMAGILIYTASGDCEGSMGGLVRMGEPEHFARIFDAAVADAAWCSGDPVCSESGLNGGQGIDGLNIAACHCCALLPETSCEHFNSLLDRSLVSSRYQGDKTGYLT
jgi:hypothetical protein